MVISCLNLLLVIKLILWLVYDAKSQSYTIQILVIVSITMVIVK